MAAEEVVIGGIYISIYGMKFLVFDVGFHTENKTNVVVYRQYSGEGQILVAPFDAFTESLPNGDKRFRFTGERIFEINARKRGKRRKLG